MNPEEKDYQEALRRIREAEKRGAIQGGNSVSALLRSSSGVANAWRLSAYDFRLDLRLPNLNRLPPEMLKLFELPFAFQRSI